MKRKKIDFAEKIYNLKDILFKSRSVEKLKKSLENLANAISLGVNDGLVPEDFAGDTMQESTNFAKSAIRRLEEKKKKN